MKIIYAIASYILITTAVSQAAGPVVIAHRGASGYLPEHTLEAKAMAHALGADYLEQDIVLSKDGVPVVLHDVYIDTVTDVARVFPDRKRADGRYYALDFTLDELKRLRVTERFSARTGERVFKGRFPAWQSVFRISTLEEELQLIQGMNQSTGRVAGIYPEIKQPGWHRKQGHDISRIVLPILERHGYKTKADACWVQCFEYDEVLRIRNELGWRGRLLLLAGSRDKMPGGPEFAKADSAAPFKKLAAVVDGLGPPLGLIATWDKNGKSRVGDFVRYARDAGLAVHPYTVRADELPKNCPSLDALHAAIFRDAGIDGVFTDFSDKTIAWLKKNGMREN